MCGQSCLSENEENRKRQANVVAVGNVRLGVLKAADFLAVCGNLDSAMNREFNRKAMRTVPLLKSNLTDAQLEELLREVEDVTYPSGETIFSQDEEGTSFYIIKSGNVEVQKGGKKVNACATRMRARAVRAHPRCSEALLRCPERLLRASPQSGRQRTPCHCRSTPPRHCRSARHAAQRARSRRQPARC
jgi:hypothetical protein